MNIDKNKFFSLFTKFNNNSEWICKEIEKNASCLNIEDTKLASLLKDFDLGFIKVFLPPKNPRLISRKKWKQYLEDNELKNLSYDDIFNLAFEFQVLDNMRYVEILKNFNADRIIFALVRNIHYYWTDLTNLEKIISAVKNLLKNTNTDKKIIKTWQKSPEYILGSPNLSLEKLLLTAIKHNIVDIDTLYANKQYDIEKFDLLANLIQCEYISYIFQKNDFMKNFDEYFARFKTFFNFSMKPQFRPEDTRTVSESLNDKRNALLAELILMVENYKNSELYEQEIIDFIMSIPIYGDPRLKKWENFKYTKALDTIKTWLNKRDIKFFFETLIEDDPHRRKDFWIKYANKVESAEFIIKYDAKFNNKSYDSDMVFRVGCVDNLIKSNIFVLKMKDLVILEFSEKNNACYIYDRDYYDKNLRCLYLTKYSRVNFKKDLSSMKVKEHCLKFFYHGGAWENNVKAFLAEHDIYQN